MRGKGTEPLWRRLPGFFIDRTAGSGPKHLAGRRVRDFFIFIKIVAMTENVEAVKAEETVKAEAAEPAKNPLEKSVTFTVSAKALREGTEAEIKRLGKKAKMPGFRPGHVPAATVRAMYGQQAYMDTLNELLGKAYEKAVEDAKLAVAGQPQIKPEQTAEGEDLKFTATVECMPEFDLPAFDKIECKRYVCDVTDAEVQKTIDIMVKQRAKYEAEEGRRAQAEDRVTVNFKGTKEGVAFAGGTADGFVFILAQGQMLPEFETAVTGLAAGEKKSFDLTFPAEYSAKDLAGQTVQFEVEVVKVEKPLYPAVDDEFAKSLGLESAEKMREEVLKNLQREVKARVTNRTKLEVMDQLTKLATFALPKALVADEQQNLANAAARDMAARGMDPKKMPKLPLEIFADQADKRVRLGLLVSKLVAEEKLAATEADVKPMVEEAASAYENPESVVEQMMKDRAAVANMYNLATENKVVEFVLGKAKTTEEKLAFDKLMTGAPQF